MFPVIKKLNVSLQVKLNGDSNKIKFPFKNDTPELRNIRLWGLQTYYGQDQQITGNFPTDITYYDNLIGKFEFQNCFINLYDRKNVNFLKDAPAVIFQTVQIGVEGKDFNITERDNKIFCGQILDLQNSYIEFTGLANTPIQARETKIFNCDIYYSKIDEKIPFLKN